MTERYRYDTAYGTLYEWDESEQSYIYACRNPFNLSKRALIREYEEERGETNY